MTFTWCSHNWLDPTVAPFYRRPVAPIVGDQPGMMQPGKTYRCSNCGLTWDVPVRIPQLIVVKATS